MSLYQILFFRARLLPNHPLVPRVFAVPVLEMSIFRILLYGMLILKAAVVGVTIFVMRFFGASS